MHRSVRFVLQPYKSRNPPLAAVTQARRDANSGSYGYKAVVTKQPLNRGCPMPDIAHAPDHIRTSPRKLPACSCGNLSLQRILRTSSSNIISYISSVCNKQYNKIFTKVYMVFLCIFHKYPQISFKTAQIYRLRFVFRRRIFGSFAKITIRAGRFTDQSPSFSSFCSSSSGISPFAALNLSSDLQKSSLSHSGSRIRISASEAISAPKKTRMF